MTIRFDSARRPLSGAALLVLLAGSALAQDEGLYPEPSSPDAAFLRVLAPGGAAVAVDDQTLLPGEVGFTPYVEVAPGSVTVSVDGQETTVEPAPNTHYTFVVSGEDGGELLADGVTGSPAQADLVFYNLSDLDGIDVFVPSADALAVEGVAADAEASVALRAPLSLDLQIRNGEDVLAEVSGVELVRSGSTSVVLSGEAGAYEADAEQNTYAD